MSRSVLSMAAVVAAATSLAVLPVAAGASNAPQQPGPTMPQPAPKPGPMKLAITQATQKTNLHGKITIKARTFNETQTYAWSTPIQHGIGGKTLQLQVTGFNAGGGNGIVDACTATTDAQGYATCTFYAPSSIGGQPASSFMGQAYYETGNYQTSLYTSKTVTLVP